MKNIYAWIAQLVERRIEAPGVGSSSLSPGTSGSWKEPKTSPRRGR